MYSFRNGWRESSINVVLYFDELEMCVDSMTCFNSEQIDFMLFLIAFLWLFHLMFKPEKL